MLHVGLDLSRTRLDVHVMDETGAPVLVTTAAPDSGGLASLVHRVGEFGQPVVAAIESMTGARFVHDQLELRGWEVQVADAGLGQGAGTAGGQDRRDRRLGAGRAVPAGSGAGDLAARSGRARRVGAGPLAAAPGAPPHRAEEPHPRHPDGLGPSLSGGGPVRRRGSAAARRSGAARAVGRGRGRRAAPNRQPRRGDQRLRGGAACGRCRPSLRAVADERAGIGPVLGYTIAAEIGDIARFPTAKKLVGYTGLCPTVRQSGGKDHRDSLAKNGPKYLRWALIEAATHAARHPAYAERYQRMKARLGKQRGAKIARVDLARRLAEAIWWMLTTNKSFAPAGAAKPLVA